MNSTKKKRTSPPVLWWDDRGEIACDQHIPYPGSDTFVLDRWRRIPADEAAAFEREVGRPPSCETCDAIGRLDPPY